MANRDLIKTAGTVLDYTCRMVDPWRPTSEDIMREFDIDDYQCQTVKSHAKRLAADRGFTWGYDHKFNCFRPVPDNDHETSQRINGYAYKQWARTGKSNGHMIRGAHRQGLVTSDSYEVASDMTQDGVRIIGKAYSSLEWTG